MEKQSILILKHENSDLTKEQLTEAIKIARIVTSVEIKTISESEYWKIQVNNVQQAFDFGFALHSIVTKK